jgi:hypothetical protein
VHFGGMPRFYFNVYDDDITLDQEGTELADISAARELGRREVRGLAAESIKSHGSLDLDHRIEILDESGTVISTVRFGDVVKVR